LTLFLLAQSFPTWEEHLRQHTGRLTGTDREHEELAHSIAVDVASAHLFPAATRTEQASITAAGDAQPGSQVGAGPSYGT